MKCRACPYDNEILLKNYERHLIRQHPDENPKDPRGKGSSKAVSIATLLWNQKRKQEEEEQDVGASGPSSKKLHHSSGDSGYGVPETEQDTDPEVSDSVFLREDGTTATSSRGSQEETTEETQPIVTEAEQDNTAPPSSKKPRHSSGDFGFGVPETEQDTDPEGYDTVFLRNDGTKVSKSAEGVNNEDIMKKVLENKLALEQMLAKQDNLLQKLENSRVLVSKPEPESTAKTVFLREDGTTVSDQTETAGPDFRTVTNVKDFEKFGFKHSHDGEISLLSCILCQAEFKYVGPQDVGSGIHPREFRNLKAHLKKHFATKRHLDKDEEVRKEKEEMKKLVSLDQKAGKNLVRAAYNVIKSRNPETHYENEVFLMYKAGGTVGNLNHSKNFIPKIRPHLASSVRYLKTHFLTYVMPQTGYLPPMAIMADGATFKRY